MFAVTGASARIDTRRLLIYFGLLCWTNAKVIYVLNSNSSAESTNSNFLDFPEEKTTSTLVIDDDEIAAVENATFVVFGTNPTSDNSTDSETELDELEWTGSDVTEPVHIENSSSEMVFGNYTEFVPPAWSARFTLTDAVMPENVRINITIYNIEVCLTS